MDGSINDSGSFKVGGTAVQALTETSDITVNSLTGGTSTSTGKAKIGTRHTNWAAFANSARFLDANCALIQNNVGVTFLNAVSGQYVGFRIQNAGKMRLLSNGNFGIGLVAPTEKLEVNGTVKATDFKFSITGGATYLASSLYSTSVGAFRDARWCVVRRVPGIFPSGLCY